MTHSHTDHLDHDPGLPKKLPGVDPSVQRPFWSVIIPLYDRTEFLPQCLSSVLDQAPSSAEMEIIVHDDCSPRDLRGLVQRLGRDRVRYERTSRQRGLYPSVNEALGKTIGQWIHVLHDDDFVLPGFYATMQGGAGHQPENIGVAFCQYSNVNEIGETIWTSEPFREGPGTLDGWLEFVALGNPLNVPAVVYRRAVFEHIGLYREDLPYTGDWEFYIRAAARFDFWQQPENLARFRVHARNQSWGLKAQGRAAADIRRTIDIAASHLPADVAKRVLPRARQNQCRELCAEALTALREGEIQYGLILLVQCVQFGSDVLAMQELHEALSHPAAARLRSSLTERTMPAQQ